MRNLFRITYSLKTTILNNGEFLTERKDERYSTVLNSNDLNEIFTDLFDLHRHDGIIGLEILSVEEEKNTSDLKEIYDILYA